MTETLASSSPLWGQELVSDKIWLYRDQTFTSRFTFQSGLPLELTTTGPLLPTLTPGRKLHLALKRGLDIVVSVLALVVLLPLFIAVAIAIGMTSPGPVIFVQSRPGLGGRPFRLLKFRTFYLEHTDPSGIAQTRRGDVRVTPLGRILRKRSIDELPQLVNVLLGQMSVVGPRPHVFGMKAAGIDYRSLVQYYDLRTAMRPGLTGWAQANGLRGPTDNVKAAKDRIDHDMAYIGNFTIWLDIKIIWKTFCGELWRGTGV